MNEHLVMFTQPSQDVNSSRTKIVLMTPTLDDLFVSLLAAVPSPASQALTNTAQRPNDIVTWFSNFHVISAFRSPPAVQYDRSFRVVRIVLKIFQVNFEHFF